MKTLKNYFEKALTVLVMLLGLVSFASCGDDDEDATEPTVTVQKTEIYIDIEPTQDMLDYCAMTLVYTDESTQEHLSYKIDKLSNKIRLTTLTKFPAKGKVELFSEPKEGVSFPAGKELFNYQHKYAIYGVVYYSNGKSEATGSIVANASPSALRVEQMNDWYSKYGIHKLKSIVVDADGFLKTN